VFPLSGGLSALGRPVELAARAYFRSINEAGGIDGRKIEFIAETTDADPNRTRAAAESSVSRDHIFAMGRVTPFSPDLVPFLESKGVPFVGSTASTSRVYLAHHVSIGASIAPHARRCSFPYWFEKTHAKRIGVIYLDVPPAISYLRETRDVICPKIAGQVVASRAVQFTTTDYATILLFDAVEQRRAFFIVTDPRRR